MGQPLPAVVVSELNRAAAAFGIVLPGNAVERFQSYIETLLLWRTRLSLTTAATAEQIIQRHIADSFAVVGFAKPGLRIADLGSGAGFPGIPVAIACPSVGVVLIESRRKRASFLAEVARHARLDNVDVSHQRAEALGEEWEGKFDVVVARAVGRVDEFLALAAPLLKSKGLAIAMKGPKGLEEDVGTCAPSQFSGPQVHRYSLCGNVSRMLLTYRRR